MDLWQTLLNRIERDHLGNRAVRQIHYVARVLGSPGASMHLHLEELPQFNRLVDWLLKASGAKEKGIRNALRFDITTRQVYLAGLPRRFNGTRILHLSDIHLDAHPGFGAHLGRCVEKLDFDLALITGDFRFRTTGPYENTLKELEDLVPALQCPYGLYAILGNHDFIEMVPPIESLGVRLLINEAVNLGDDLAPFWLAGVDDTHFYKTHDLKQTLREIDPTHSVLLMAHSPEIIESAARRGCDFYLCGHTHGGQICLPGRYALWTNARCKRRFTAGFWKYGAMQGYTSAGTGSSGVFARFHCPPEIAIHVLNNGE